MEVKWDLEATKKEKPLVSGTIGTGNNTTINNVILVDVQNEMGCKIALVRSDHGGEFENKEFENLFYQNGISHDFSCPRILQQNGFVERKNRALQEMARTMIHETGMAKQLLPLIKFTYNNSFHTSIGMAPYKALYGRRCRTPLCWHQDEENLDIGPELVQQATEEVKRVQERMRISQSRQKSYAYNRRKELEFHARDHITERVGPVAYRIALPPFPSNFHDVLHVSQLRKYMADDSHVIEPDDIQLKDDLTMEMPPIKIVDTSTKRMRNKEVSLVKVIWN
ncbi:uncharacterized protein LOC130712748 [Lotus japonicus]|uniref:uncharacterized protein LOC130712748 n=1 Tax=Lotus japonicus TaxID=34305 RepID=UPI0025870339|nr:uncharacterized protein LOC130712748 [Lotus japonicus]